MEAAGRGQQRDQAGKMGSSKEQPTWGQSLYFKNSLKKILFHQIPALGPFRRDHSQFTRVEKTNQPHATQAPKLKAVLTHSSSGEGSGHCRRCCPFSVRFADETLRDTALRDFCQGFPHAVSAHLGTHNLSLLTPHMASRVWRRIQQCNSLIYLLSTDCGHRKLEVEAAILPNFWLFDGAAKALRADDTAAEKRSQIRQGILENRTASGSAASEQVFGRVGRWLESLPKALYPRAKEDTMANSFGWDFPGLSTLEPKGHVSEDTSMNSSLPFIPRPTIQRQRSGGTSKPFWSRFGPATHRRSNCWAKFGPLPSLLEAALWLQPLAKAGIEVFIATSRPVKKQPRNPHPDAVLNSKGWDLVLIFPEEPAGPGEGLILFCTFSSWHCTTHLALSEPQFPRQSRGGPQTGHRLQRRAAPTRGQCWPGFGAARRGRNFSASC
ncbi:PREDICTED: uncharacterized protein LOC103084404 [Lipotes vexillifer]|uniref:Uncharacterized protein LOC103084404 n=1 Tax=Lipotes vexillifer TaxID=118797 RepID=A0A340YHF5_LIPVE|nr:PREDICTED: uncharacterized protein LOC103084404 [Lipotes vexillifer]